MNFLPVFLLLSADAFPIWDEISTAVKSTAKLVGAGIVAPFDPKKAGKLASDAGTDWVKYSEQSMIVGPINAGIREAIGDDKGAARVIHETEDAFMEEPNVLGLGQVKGIVYLAKGENEMARETMLSGARNTLILGVGAATGGAGAGVFAAGTAAAGTGVAFDGAHSAIDSAVQDERSTHGVWDIDRKVDESGAIVAGLDAAAAVAADFGVGSSGLALKQEGVVESLKEFAKEEAGDQLKEFADE